ILGVVGERKFDVLYEPFAGSAAITIAGAARGIAKQYALSDTLGPLVEIWDAVIDRPTQLADHYERVWTAQFDGDSIKHFNTVRKEFNEQPDAAKLLYLFARCVKNAPRFNGDGAFNQSADKRRHGMRAPKMRCEI